MVFIKSLIVAVLAVVAVKANVLQQSSRTPAACAYVLPNIPGGFSQRRFADFSSNTPSDNPATVLGTYNIGISNYGPVPSTPLTHTFVPENVAFGNGYLGLKTSAYASGSVQSGEIVTNDVFMYASVRTVLKSTATPGIVEGNFFYLDVATGAQEIDFEILTTTIFSSNNPLVPPGIWATNYNNTGSRINTVSTIPFTFDPRTDYHEYRIDSFFQWFGTTTNFYIDGVRVAQHAEPSTTPTVPGHWIWNSWSSGDVNWSMGPPTADGIYQIRSIDLYTGYTSTC
ncbi:hypothetical protein JR316_0001801 [Psilocybe cubensis]|uniref:Uncharacterized protein n=2 Tax=Psilocybe cubensis TaxID=181762 RepID=A0ACB8HAP2_PSICU|nr:hypothetical protein JR316_0001801 [Psilocybe cubensis]KAH9484899.1 hypothetical protein JR316_0001801 [Psilocybe cubensis]